MIFDQDVAQDAEPRSAGSRGQLTGEFFYY